MRFVFSFVALAAAALLIAGVLRSYAQRDDPTAPDSESSPTPALFRDSEGNTVSRDRLEIVRGPEDCDWDSSLMLFTGDPIGSVMVRRQSERQYVRDPEGVYPHEYLVMAYEGDTRLPSIATPSGFSWEGKPLWLDPVGPDTAVYVVYDDHVERWPRTNPIIRCA